MRVSSPEVWLVPDSADYSAARRDTPGLESVDLDRRAVSLKTRLFGLEGKMCSP